MRGLECIGIDEFATAKGHVYKTIVVNLMTGQIVYVGDGKGTDALAEFWKIVKKAGYVIKSVATDLSATFISSVMSNALNLNEPLMKAYYLKESLKGDMDTNQ